MYSLNYKVTTSTCDSEGRLKLYSALQMMQDCSEMWIDSEPDVKRYFTEQNMAQLLATRQVEILRVPEYKENLTVATSVYGMKPMFGFRNTFIYDSEGKPCYRTWSMGAFVDKAAGKLKRVDDATIASMTLEPQLEMNYKDRRIILPKDGGEVLEPIKVLRADIDYNKHVNNANYVRMAMELLPENFKVQGLRVEYRVAAKLGDVLIPTVYKTEGGVIVMGISPDNGIQTNFIDYDAERHEKMKRLDEALDKINCEFGSETIVLGSQQYTKPGGKGKADVFKDSIKHDFRSPCYTTRWSDIPEAT